MKKTLNRELKLFEVAESESFGGKSRVMSLVSFPLGAEGGEGFPLFPFCSQRGTPNQGWRAGACRSKTQK